MINTLYSKDISRKVSTALKAQMESGEFKKPDLRKDPFQIGSSLDVVTPEPAEITNYKALDLWMSSQIRLRFASPTLQSVPT